VQNLASSFDTSQLVKIIPVRSACDMLKVNRGQGYTVNVQISSKYPYHIENLGRRTQRRYMSEF